MRISLNAYLALALLGALLLAPLFLIVGPFLWLWVRSELERRDREGWRVLWPSMARTIQSFAPIVLREEGSDNEWNSVARRVDDYLALVTGNRRWRTLALLFVLEFAPLLRGYAPLSRLSPARRQQFADRHLAAPRGIMRIVALSRQLVRIGFYGQKIATLRVEPRNVPRERISLVISA